MKRTFRVNAESMNFPDNWWEDSGGIPVVPERQYRKFRLLNGSERITNRKNIMIRYDYPLNGPFYFPAVATKWTMENIIKEIRAGYQKIYRSPAKYGVWGHSIEDLVIEAVVTSGDGKTITLFMGS